MLQVLPRRFLLLAFAFTALMLSGAEVVHADTAKPAATPSAIKAWVLPVMGASITRSKIAVFIGDLSEAVGRSIDMHYSNDTDELLSVCKRQEADLFLLSNDARTEKIRTVCGYKDVARSSNAINLYVKGDTTRENVRRVGLIHYTRSHDVAKQELQGLEFIEYGDIPKAFMALLDGRVDAVVSPPAITMMVADQLRQKLRSVQTLQERGESVMLFSPRFMATPASQKMTEAVLQNMPSSRALFKDMLGSDDWQPIK